MYGSRDCRTQLVAEAIKSVDIAQVILVAGGTIAVYLWLCRSRHSWWAIRPQAKHRSPEQTPEERTQSTRQVPGFGLRHVNPPSEGESETATDIDIIAIHGLDTKSPDTWIWKDKQGKRLDVNWLSNRYMLPSKVGQARIFTYDWPADLFKQSDSRPMMIEEFARPLLNDIRRRPLATNDGAGGEDRPILFIASCLGGIILMKALVMATSEYDSVRRATGGIIFLATPFRGTSFQEVAGWVEPGLKAWASIQGRKVTKLLDNVKESFNLRELVCSFTQLCLDPAHPYQVITFYELGKTNLYHKVFPCLPVGAKQLVDEFSGTLDIVPHPLPLNRTHVMMNKFSHSECTDQCKSRCEEREDFERVSRKIQEFLEKIREGSPLKRADVWIRDNHYTPERLKIERLSGDPLSMEQCYINLAIVEQPGENANRSKERSKTALEGDAAPQSSPFSRAARLNVETPDEKFLIELSTLFDSRQGPDGQTKSPRRILIRGRAGVGKTTLCKKIVYEFNRGAWSEWSKLFDRVLWVPLRNLKLPERRQIAGYNFIHLFDHEYFSQAENGKDLAEALRHTIRETKSSKTLFLLDGLDEVYQELNGDMGRFLNSLFDQPNLIITSRPHASLPILDHPIDLRLETIGFSPGQVSQYLKEVFSKEQEKVGKIQLFLENHQLVQDLVRIPIQLDALCYTYDSDAFPGALPENMTALYEAISHGLWKKDAVRLEKCSQGKQVTDDNIRDYRWPQLEELVQSEAHFLERLAFTGLHSDVINFDSTQHLDRILPHFQLSGTRFSFDETLARLSFLRSPNPSSKRGSRSYHFLHLTFQEYFAARYFVEQWMSGEDVEYLQLKTRAIQQSRPNNCLQEQCTAVSYLQKHKYDARYDIFWRFVTGLLQAKGGDERLCDFFKTIQKEPRDLLGPIHQRLVMHCLSEVVVSEEVKRFTSLRENLEDQLSRWLLFECNLTGHSQLAAEVEFPEQALKNMLESQDVKEQVLRSLQARPRISPTIVELVIPSLKDPEGYIRRITIEALDKESTLSSKILEILVAQLEDPDEYVRCAAVEALGKQLALSEKVLEAVAARLEDPSEYVRRAAVEALGKQSALSEKVLEAVAARLEHPEGYIRCITIEALSKQSALLKKILEAMAAQLYGTNGDVRNTAVEALSKQTALSDKILEAVAAQLEDPDGDVRNTAVEALGKQSALSDKILEAVVARLKDLEWYVRRAAVEVLGKQSALSDKILEAVAALLEDTKWEVRNTAVRAIGQQSTLSEKILEAVAARLEDTEWDIRCAAVQVLGKQSALSKKVLGTMVARLEHPEREVRDGAVEVLGKQSALPEKVLKAVWTRLEHPEGYVRCAAVEVLDKQSALSDKILMALALEDPNGDVRCAAVEALGKQSALSEKVLEAMAAWLEDTMWHVRHAAVEVLGKQSALSEKILEAVAALLEDTEWDIRCAAVQVLGKQSAPSEKILEAVAAMLEDTERDIRCAAVQVLGKQSALSEKILEAVAARLEDPEEDVRSAAARVLGKQSTLSEKILETLAAWLEDPHWFVRDATVEALGKLWALPEKRFPSLLTKISSKAFTSLYGFWLKRSFKEHVVWYIDGEAYLDLPEGSKTFPFDGLESKIQDAQTSLDVPLRGEKMCDS